MNKASSTPVNRPQTPRTAAQAYADAQTEITHQLTLVVRKLKEHAEQQSRDPLNWGFVGDLTRINELLKQCH